MTSKHKFSLRYKFSLTEGDWDYLATDWLDGLAVDILNKDAQNIYRRLVETVADLEDVRQYLGVSAEPKAGTE